MHAPSPQPHVILIGAGLSGSLLAVYLARRGYRVDVYERRVDMRRERISAGRSINLALSARGIHALEEVGLYEEILPIVNPMRGRMLHAVDGRTIFSPYGQNEREVINAVSRGDLNMKLMDLAERQPGVALHFQQRCIGMDLERGEVELRDERTGAVSRVRGDTAIGTDGSASAMRDAMMRALPRFNFSQQYLEHGYKELLLPAGADGSFRIERNALHIWPRHSYMLIALPNIDGSFTCTLFYPHEGDSSFASMTTAEAVRAFFRREFPDFAAHIPDLAEQFLGNPTGALATVRCQPWHVDGKAALLGDAAHAIVPFFGQGMNCSFEDCVWLNRCIDERGPDWPNVYADYEQLRKRNADAIADLALENFVEMRDLVADPHFLFMKRVGLELERRHPDRFIPKYSMVSFHRIPYATALERGRQQDEILTRLCAGMDNVDAIDWTAAERMIAASLAPLDLAD
jgi:kynurenine 3-monooxygenase